MGSNAEIRQRMDTYRGILFLINWIGSIIVSIVGFSLIDRIGGFTAIIIIILAILLGIIGHFLINVALAIHFILLNNGDILESIKRNEVVNNNDNSKNEQNKNEAEKIIQHEVKYTVEEENKNAEIERLEKQFESSTDEKEKGVIAKKLNDLGKTYYWRFIPKEKK